LNSQAPRIGGRPWIEIHGLGACFVVHSQINPAHNRRLGLVIGTVRRGLNRKPLISASAYWMFGSVESPGGLRGAMVIQ